MTTALEGGEGQRHAPAALYPGKESGWAPGPVGQVRKISTPSGFDPQIVQPVASRYIHYTTRPTLPFDPSTVQPVASRYTHYTTRPTLPFDPQTVQPVASRYTDYATRPIYDGLHNLKYAGN